MIRTATYLATLHEDKSTFPATYNAFFFVVRQVAKKNQFFFPLLTHDWCCLFVDEQEN